MFILIYFFIGISLSMDAFSLSLSLGTTNPNKTTIIKTSIIVGLFHFIMPIIGYKISTTFLSFINHSNYVTSILFLILAIEMYLNKNKEEEIIILNNITILLIALTVSLDSLTVGMALGLNQDNIIIPSIIISITSMTFTLIGLLLGKTLSNKYKTLSTYLGIIIMIIVSIKYLINI